MSETEIVSRKAEITVVILTNNRPDRCADCVHKLAGKLNNLPADILVINNGGKNLSLPGTINNTPCRTINISKNLGAAARNIALKETNSKYLIMLDDDAYFEASIFQEMVDIFESDSGIGGIAFRIHNGNVEESCMLPTIFHGCACGFRASALKEIGGYPEDFEYYGEEYLIAFQLYNAGYSIAMLNHGTHVHHARDPIGRNKCRIIRLLVRNNVYTWTKSFPWSYILDATRDTLQRYSNVSKKENAKKGFFSGYSTIPSAIFRGILHRKAFDEKTFKRITLIKQLEDICSQLNKENIKDIIVCGVGKFPSIWLRIFKKHEIKVKAFLETNPCWKNQEIKGIPVHVVSQSNSSTSSHSHLPHKIIPILQLLQEPEDETDKEIWANEHTPIPILIGLSSVAEKNYWKEHLLTTGKMSRMIFESKQENISRSGTIDLLTGAHIEIYSINNSMQKAS